MNKALKIYLLVTGVLAGAALLAPGLVILGYFLFIVPGLILSLAPTAFMWGCIFALSRRLFSTVLNSGYAGAAALAVTLAIVFGVPWPWLQRGRQLLATSTLPDISSDRPIQPSGDIRLDIAARPDNSNPPAKGHVRAFACDNLCVALLFTPGVTSVTVNDSGHFTPEQHRDGAGPLAAGARTYRLVPKAACGDSAVKVDLQGRTGLFGKTLEENRAIEAEWNLKLSGEYCVVAAPPISTSAVSVRTGRYSQPDAGRRPTGRWSLGGPRAEISYVEIRGAEGRIALRRVVSRVHVLAPPLSIWPSGGLENFHFGWNRTTLSNAARYAEADLVEILKAHSTLAAPPAPSNLLPLIRERLKDAVADRSLPPSDPAFATMENYFAMVDKPLGDADLALVGALILDERSTSYQGLYHLNKVPAEQHRKIRAVVVQRLLTGANVPGLAKGRLGQWLAESPPGAFATLSDDERRLLASPDRRVAAAGLVARLSDLGADAVPLLLEILRYHGRALGAALASRENATQRSALMDSHRPMVGASRVAFCRLGDVAAPALAQIEAMIAEGVIPRYSLTGHGGTDWDLTRVRLGKPLDTIRKPESLSGSEANYRRNLQEKLRRFDPGRSCGDF